MWGRSFSLGGGRDGSPGMDTHGLWHLWPIYWVSTE